MTPPIAAGMPGAQGLIGLFGGNAPGGLGRLAGILLGRGAERGAALGGVVGAALPLIVGVALPAIAQVGAAILARATGDRPPTFNECMLRCDRDAEEGLPRLLCYIICQIMARD